MAHSKVKPMMNQGARFHRCDYIGAMVRIDRTEGQCRDQHHCSVYRCPLQDKFADERPNISMQELAAGWCGVFPSKPRRHG